MSARTQMEKRVPPIKRSQRRAQVRRKAPLTHNMAKFTIEWLSQSCYSAQESVKEDVEEFTPASPNNSCGYTSASENSDAGEDSEVEAARRVRTKFSSEQIHKLESAFSKHRYLGASQRRRIAEKLHLSETQVKTWFQNRRMKLKREVQDTRAEFLAVPAALLPPVMFQHHALCGQLPGVSGGLYPLHEAHRAAAYPAVPRQHLYHRYTAVHALPTHQVIPAFY